MRMGNGSRSMLEDPRSWELIGTSCDEDKDRCVFLGKEAYDGQFAADFFHVRKLHLLFQRDFLLGNLKFPDFMKSFLSLAWTVSASSPKARTI